MTTIWQDNAALAATRDRRATANLVLELAVGEAMLLIRAGRPGLAEFVMRRALRKAERILGPAVTS